MTSKKDKKFTYEMMVEDLKDNAKRILKGGWLEISEITETLLQIADSPEMNARIYLSSADQYTIRIYEGLLKACYAYANSDIRDYYPTIAHRSNFTEELFIRTVCSCVTEFIFWHEYSHIARGHLNFLSSRKKLWAADSSSTLELIDRRLVELDADIYAASFLLARTYSVYLSSNGAYPLQDLMQAYSTGIRVLFEVLHRNNDFEDDTHELSDHPHSLARAYAAIAFGLTGPVGDKIGADGAACQSIAIAELLSYEMSTRTTPVDTAILQSYMDKEAVLWGARAHEINDYFQLTVRTVPVFTKIRGRARKMMMFVRQYLNV
ncbi:hypothetical protein V5F23_17315 [Pseudomonas sp. WP18]|uniref:hypothetical protein n=1 Tax=Pseudomonas sp. WP18 TaxID=3118752 RepID=UPI0030D3A1AE